MNSQQDFINKVRLEDLFDDFNHPNPNINNEACSQMAQFWPKESIEKLIVNFVFDV